MPHGLILAPMGVLALLTFTALLFVPIRRFRAAFAGQVRAGDFKYGESPRVPGEVSIPNRNYMNLLELPLLFYVICLIYYVTAPTVCARHAGAGLGLCWLAAAAQPGAPHLQQRDASAGRVCNQQFRARRLVDHVLRELFLALIHTCHSLPRPC